MPNTCKTCRHPQRKAIEKDLIRRTPLREIADQYGPRHQSLLRHFYRCMNGAAERAREREVASADAAISHLKWQDETLREAAAMAKEGTVVGVDDGGNPIFKPDPKAMVSAVQAMNGVQKVRGVLGGYWVERSESDINVSSDSITNLVRSIAVALADEPAALAKIRPLLEAFDAQVGATVETTARDVTPTARTLVEN